MLSKSKSPKLSHYDASGTARMVDVSPKQSTRRTATASAFVEGVVEDLGDEAKHHLDIGAQRLRSSKTKVTGANAICCACSRRICHRIFVRAEWSG